ncbi:MAG: aldehyde dehydrogenase family protein, partial [bacterium]|nr:aldehyde dehydrogenase family protein [bacterium]
TLYDELRDRLAAAARELVMGDPLDEATFLGPLISEDDAVRVAAWVDEATAAGARLVCGGERRGPFYTATLLENVPRGLPVSCREVFGPVVVLERFTDFADAVARVNDSEYGLQAGVFTRDLGRARFAAEACEVGGVVIGDVPSFRVDSMPYGGVKRSGFGREGVRFAMEEMTELRLTVFNDNYLRPGGAT